VTSSVSLPNQTNSSIQIENSAVITPNGRYLYQNDVYQSGPDYFPTVVQIAGFSIDSATGALSPVPGSPISPGIPSTSSPAQMAIDTTGKFLYASYTFVIVNVREDGGVAAFSIDPTSGELTAVPGSPFSVGGIPNSVAVDSSGRFLIVSIIPQAPGNCLAVLSIDPGTGALTRVPGSPFGPLHSCGPAVTDPSGPFVYAGAYSANLSTPATVFVLSIDPATGALAPITETAFPDSSKVFVGAIALTH